LEFFWSTFFGRFLARGIQKHHGNRKCFLQKVHLQKHRKEVHVSDFNRQGNRQCQFFHGILVYRVFGCFSAMGVKKKIASKRFCKKIGKKIQNRFFLFLNLFYRIFGSLSENTKNVISFYPATFLPTRTTNRDIARALEGRIKVKVGHDRRPMGLWRVGLQETQFAAASSWC
jgi:hypothetical protein